MIPHRFQLSRCVFVLILAILTSCIKSPSEPAVQEPSSITLSSSTIVLTAIGQRIRIAATVLDQDSKVIADATVFFRSGNVNIATVSDQGVVTAVSMGSTQITVSSGYATASATVSVEQEAGSIVVTPSSATLDRVGQTVQLEAVVYDTGNTAIPGAAVLWSSSNPEYATVDANGLVPAVSSGTTQITATSGGVETSRPVFVEIMQVAVIIELNLSKATLTSIGQTVQLGALVYDSDGVAIPRAVVAWSSSHPEVATVDSTGLVAAVSNGTTLVTATSGAVSTTATITVVIGQEAASITVIPESATLTSFGQSVQLEAVVQEIDGTVIPDAPVAWSSSDPDVASVSENGLVTAISNGGVWIRALSGDVSTISVITVMQAAASVAITPETATLSSVGETVQLETVVYDAEGAAIPDAPVMWSSDDPVVAAVDANGLVTAVSNGSVQITATSGDASAISVITVKQAAASVIITPEAATLDSIGEAVQFEAVAYDMEGAAVSGAPVSWSSSDPEVATVDSTGLATGVGAGETTITATSGEVSGTARLTVTRPPPPPPPPPPTPQTGPDLIVSSPSVTDNSPETGDSFTLSATVRNDGNDASAATTLSYYRSTDVTITTADTEVDTDTVRALMASGTSEESVSLTAPASAGTYYYGACVDAVTGESNTSNNCSGSVQVTVSEPQPRPELRAIALGVVIGRPAPGGTFSLWARVINEGQGESAATTMRILHSIDDDVIEPTDMVERSYSVGALSAGERSAVEMLDLTASLTPGEYYYGVCVDTVTGESNTDNNCDNHPPVIVTAPPRTRPDLAVGSTSVTDSSPDTGESFTLSATVRNYGDGAAAATTLRYYRSTDAHITTSDTQVGTDAVGALAASGTSNESVGLTAPASAGTYYYGACVDAVTGEFSLANNCSPSVQVTVSAAPPQTRPDLTVGSPSVTDSSPGTGDSFNLTATVRNIGDGGSAATTLRYYRSTDATITSSDTQEDTDAVGTLAASGTSDESVVLTAPSTAGTYYYGACVDAVTGESDTTNNCSGSVRVTVSEPPPQTSPDLTVGTPSVTDSTPETGDSFNLSATVSNIGDGASAGPHILHYYRSTDATITTSDTKFASIAFTKELDASESIDLETTGVLAPSMAGTYYYGACVDAVTGESDTTNNCSSAVQVTVTAATPGPDLKVYAFVAFTSLGGTPPGGSIQLSAGVENEGDESSAATTLRFYQSSDSSITTSDTQVGTGTVEVLSAGATSSSIGSTVTAPSSAGTYYYGACVDEVTDESDTTNNCSGSVPVEVTE